MCLTYRCLTIAASFLVVGFCIAEIVVTSISKDIEAGDLEIIRLVTIAVGLVAAILLFVGAVLRKRVLLWIGIPLTIVMFVILCTVDIILLIKYLHKIINKEEGFGILNIVLFLIVFPFLICVSWAYAKELRTDRSDNRCLDCLGW